MPDPTPVWQWLDEVSVLAVVLWLVGLVTLAGFVKKVHDTVRPYAQAIRDFLTDWQGTPARPGVERKPGVMERLDGQDGQIAEIRKQVTPNHGTSAHDKLARQITHVNRKVDAIFGHLGIPIPEDDPPVGGTD